MPDTQHHPTPRPAASRLDHRALVLLTAEAAAAADRLACGPLLRPTHCRAGLAGATRHPLIP
ncbi:hypothetical protein ACFU7Y_33350 [Kitasatospora sp. NPDC057542]|uniref:hypothetical protein n=1 Tax=Kitasatospora sp. NPDC057542 TaxID=3346162 RepID=UPI0036B2E322